ncbi:F0F1 ATP synthase subunit delta [Verticiella sediminum]|uniref:ATP synthase subunit delta n=1 Tax=Verticiella sediminum TaxID=1247510 RepID=A0A556B047_9BURK|nr:F0F1 ATP synthase subunit delta [Verticiella sediminum]TSH98552.1 F0F1 ATP synthase subunit delta [Verticiella sediminum]
MAELSTIARPYAEALFGAALADGADLAAWADLVAEMAQAEQHPEVQSALSSPRLDAPARVALLSSVLKSKLNPAASNFLSLLAENDRLELLPEIARQFALLKNRHDGVADARIESAFELTAAQVTELVAGLEKKFGLKLKPVVSIEPALIGGVRVSVGDQVLDASVRAQLERMRDTLVAN